MKVSDLEKTRKYLLACSFGPDSMALFDLLEKNHISFEVAHVNYHLRKEADEETRGLIKYCKKHNKILHILDVREDITKNIEERCREIRYQYFKSIYDNGTYDALLVAHNEDDHIETYLIQKSRNNCPKVYGIAPKTRIFGMRVMRPILDYSKNELLKYCKENHVPYRIDKSNLELTFLRNKIRHQIVSKMSETERKEILKEIEIENQKLTKVLESIDKTKLHEKAYLLSLDNLTYKYAINELAIEALEKAEISKGQASEILKILKSNKPNIIAHIHDNLYLIKEYDEVHFEYGHPEYQSYFHILKEPGKLDTPVFYLDFSKDASNRNVKKDDYPLIIRNAKEDDEITINGYKVTARRLFIDWKMPKSVRSFWPIILNKFNKVVYLPRYQKDFVPEENSNFYVKLK